MSKAIYRGIPLLLVALHLAACGGSAGKKKELTNRYSTNIGLASTFDLNETLRQAFNKYQFQLERYEEYGDKTYFETQWKYRSLFEDEQERNIIQAKTKIFVEARPRIRSAGETKLSNVQFIAENMVVFANTDAWIGAPMSPMCKAYLQRVADDLKTTLTAAMRRY